MNDTDNLRAQVSALVDGDLHGAEFAQVVGEVCTREELLSTWRTYHLVGDVLRSGSHVTCRDSTAFVAGFQQRLAAETNASGEGLKPLPAPAVRRRAEAANEPIFRWKLVAGAASLAAVVAIGWNVIAGTGSAPAGAVVATTKPGTTETRVMVGGEQPQVMLRDARLDALLEAHQQAGGGSQMPSGFLRNATFEGPAR